MSRVCQETRRQGVNLLKMIMAQNLKIGDKVWWFDARTQTIECGEALEVNERGGVVYTYDKNLWLGREAFPTREALCEHYRKIFE